MKKKENLLPRLLSVESMNSMLRFFFNFILTVFHRVERFHITASTALIDELFLLEGGGDIDAILPISSSLCIDRVNGRSLPRTRRTSFINILLRARLNRLIVLCDRTGCRLQLGVKKPCTPACGATEVEYRS
ncbi:ATP-dependent dethiobiotin synthetase BioD [Trichinella spiralis]|uniref:ATP-dependent dethiobiotin synthetase BioD n=1 Tax=Trichinella spiralis TaxID=6334 RepID=A0ABR3KRC1_TRISP